MNDADFSAIDLALDAVTPQTMTELAAVIGGSSIVDIAPANLLTLARINAAGSKPGGAGDGRHPLQSLATR